MREAEGADATAIAALHAASWRATYGPILGQAYLQGDIEGDRAAHWQAVFAAPLDGFVILAEADGRPAGFIAVLHGGEPGYDATIDNLHVRPGLGGRGLGRRLMATAARRLMAQGRTSVALRVLDANRHAFEFYGRLGGVSDDRGVDLHFGSDARDTRFGWHDLARLVAACEGEKS